MSNIELGVNVIESDIEHNPIDNNFLKFFQKLNSRFGPSQKSLKKLRNERLAFTSIGNFPKLLKLDSNWKAEIPEWLADQRNQMTGPANNPELVVKMLNSGSPGVMLDLEDSMANNESCLLMGHDIIKMALYGTLTYSDKLGKSVKINPSKTTVWVRVRGLHMDQIFPTRSKKAYRGSASIFDLAQHFYNLDLHKMGRAGNRAPLIYIPKSESAIEAHWWRGIFTYIEKLRGWKHGTIRCMALVESFPMAHEMEHFLFNLRPYIIGLNLGRWDYMASIGHYMIENMEWVLPDRNKIPHDASFFQSLRKLMVNTCHSHGILAIGGMTALFPSRTDEIINTKAIEQLKKDKRNESIMGMDGAWTGHPDQNDFAVKPFPIPNQIGFLHEDLNISEKDLVDPPAGEVTQEGSREAIRSVLKYRAAVKEGKGAILINGYMEDLATDRIYRVMLAQRLRHNLLSLDEFEIIMREEEKLLGQDGSEIGDIVRDLILNSKFNPE